MDLSNQSGQLKHLPNNLRSSLPFRTQGSRTLEQSHDLYLSLCLRNLSVHVAVHILLLKCFERRDEMTLHLCWSGVFSILKQTSLLLSSLCISKQKYHLIQPSSMIPSPCLHLLWQPGDVNRSKEASQRRANERKEQYKQVRAHVKKEDGRVQVKHDFV